MWGVMEPLFEVLRPIPTAFLREIGALTLYGPRAREPLKAVLSVLLAVSIATALRLDDLSWAAFSGYMVMRANISEALPRGLMRIAGTVGGAIIGLSMAPFVADAPVLLMAGLFIVSWIGTFQTLVSRYSYAWMLFGLTAGMVMTEALASPTTTLFFAGTRVTEISIGVLSSLIVVSLFESARTPVAVAAPQVAAPASPFGNLRRFLDEQWLRDHWALLTYSTRAALAVGLLPLVWRWFEIGDFSQTAVTSYVVMIVPAAAVREHRHQPIYERIAHRTIGCLLGSIVAILCLGVFSEATFPALLALCAGVWIGHHIQIGREGISYLGTQFVLGFLITYVQGPAPATSILPGLERLLGVVIGSLMLCFLILIWPQPEAEQQGKPGD
jgi:uncharacterized membrane protein YccC